MKKWLRLLWFIPLVLIIPLVNIVGDPAGIYRNDSVKIANSIIEGNYTRFGSGNCNERRIKAEIIENMPDRVDCVIVGPSTVGYIDSEMVGEELFVNLGVSSSDLYDIMAQFGLMDIYGKKYDRVIFCVDNYFFDEKFYEGFTHHDEYKAYAEYMIDRISGKQTSAPQRNRMAVIKSGMSQLFSVTYFQAAVDVINNNGIYDLLFREDWSVNPDEYQDSCFRPDASTMQSDATLNATVDDVIKHAKEYDLEYCLSKGERPTEYSKTIFEETIAYLLSEGVDVDLFLSPFSPALYERMDLSQYPMVTEVEDFAREMSACYSLDIIGSYNPEAVGIGNEAFSDGRHIKEFCIEDFFDLKRR